MGYRSNVGAMFYVVPMFDPETQKYSSDYKKRAMALLKVWWQAKMESCPKNMRDSFEAEEYGFKFFEEDVKWYDSYTDVAWFNNLAKAFIEELIENEELDGGSGLNRSYAYEFVRIGEDDTDIQSDSAGNIDYRLQVSRTMIFS